jgi:hypothetical protein
MLTGATTQVKCACGCGEVFTARVADRKRGWGRFASKACKARHQEGRTRQCSRFYQRQENRERGHEEHYFYAGGFSNEEHDCNKGDF